MNYIALAIPFFFLFIFLEARVGRRYYRLSDSINDLSCGVIQQVLGVFTATAVTAAYIYLHRHHALLPISNRSALAWVALFVGVDLCYYWFHRLSHEVNFLWAIHVVHHQSEEYNLTVALRQAAFQPLVSWVFYLPLAVLGFPPAMWLAMYSFNTLYQFWIHTRLIRRLGPLEWVLNTPSHHRVHHGSDPLYLDRNHGGTLIVWDRLFGTFQDEVHDPVYGVTRPLRSLNPLWANFHTFADLYREARQLPRLVDRLRLWIMPPGWHPAARPAHAPAAWDKYEVPVSRGTRIYVVAQFVPAILLTTVMLFGQDRLTLSQDLGLAAVVVLTLVTLGGLLERKPWARPLEAARVLVLASALAGSMTAVLCAARSIFPQI